MSFNSSNFFTNGRVRYILYVRIPVLRTLVQHLESGLIHTTLSETVSHSSRILTETSSLIRRLLHASRVHKMESALVLIVIVSVLASTTELRLVLVCVKKLKLIIFYPTEWPGITVYTYWNTFCPGMPTRSNRISVVCKMGH